MRDVFGDVKWIIDTINAEEEIERPDIIKFLNADYALQILRYHLVRGSKIKVHCDVDVDGTFSGRLFYKFVKMTGSESLMCYEINSGKVHGIDKGGITKGDADLVVVLDSSTNDIEAIKGIGCDVIVFDHHEVNVDIGLLSGKTTNSGNYVVINNMVSDDASVDMSGCQVLYEFLRYAVTKDVNIDLTDDRLSESGMDSIVAVTLFSDMVKLNNRRNQYYIQQFSDYNKETMLNYLVSQSRFDVLGKKYVLFTLAPLINGAIRAGRHKLALNVSVRNLGDIECLREYKLMQDHQTSRAMEQVEINDKYATCECDESIARTYFGVIAAKIGGNTFKNVYVYRDTGGGYVEGSFRGAGFGDYRKACIKAGAIAEGHKEAFGMTMKKDRLQNIMESTYGIGEMGKLIYVGRDANEKFPGIVVVGGLDELKSSKAIRDIAIVNARVSSRESIRIIARCEPEFLEMRGRSYRYVISGLMCTAFEEITSRDIMMYIEQSTKTDIFIENAVI